MASFKYFEYKQIFALYSQEYGEAVIDAKGESLSSSELAVVDVMNKLGLDGWELVGFLNRDDMAEANKPNYTSCIEYVFKRAR